MVEFRYHDYMINLGFSEEKAQLFAKRIVMNDLWRQLDLGIRDEKEIISEMYSRIPGYKKELDAFFENITDIVRQYEYTLPWIQDLKSKGYKVYLLSNYPKTLFELHEKEKFSFTDIVDGKVVSAFVKMAKPDAEIYKYLLEEYKLNADECVFFDDKAENVRAAESCGITSRQFTSYEDANIYINSLK